MDLTFGAHANEREFPSARDSAHRLYGPIKTINDYAGVLAGEETKKERRNVLTSWRFRLLPFSVRNAEVGSSSLLPSTNCSPTFSSVRRHTFCSAHPCCAQNAPNVGRVGGEASRFRHSDSCAYRSSSIRDVLWLRIALTVLMSRQRLDVGFQLRMSASGEVVSSVPTFIRKRPSAATSSCLRIQREPIRCLRAWTTSGTDRRRCSGSNDTRCGEVRSDGDTSGGPCGGEDQDSCEEILRKPGSEATVVKRPRNGDRDLVVTMGRRSIATVAPARRTSVSVPRPTSSTPAAVRPAGPARAR